MTGSIKDYTPNYKFILPRFDLATWHDYIETNFRSIDALFYNLFVVNQYKGMWQNSTIYNVGDVVFIGEDGGSNSEGKLYKVLIQHTTPVSGTFSEYKTEYPTYYTLYVESTIQIDSQLDITSDRPVQNSAIATAIILKANTADLATVATSGAYGDLSGTPTLATVATSGSYNDLSNKPNLSGYALDNAVVHLSSEETITGPKTFTQNVTITKQAPRIKLKHTLITKGVRPSEMRNLVLDFVDSNENELGFVRDVYYGDKSHYIQIKCDKANNPTDTDSAGIKVGYYGSTKVFCPDDDNATSLGRSDARWTQLYAGTTTISTSDEREKQNIEEIPDEILDAWGEVEFYQFKFKDSVAKKGENARIHTGLIAQRIKTVFENHNLDPFKYGLLCYDEWETNEEEQIVAGNRYALRYEECLCMETAYQRRRADKLEQRLQNIENLLNINNQGEN